MDRTGPGQEDMDRQNGSRPHGPPKKKDPDRVTLKKEIGLLSACTIIIGEEGPGPGPGLKTYFVSFDRNKKKNQVFRQNGRMGRHLRVAGKQRLHVVALTWLKCMES